MLVFVCSPYGGKKKNLDAAREYCLREIDNGNTPFAPPCTFHMAGHDQSVYTHEDGNDTRHTI